jgi:hypothetical protein
LAQLLPQPFRLPKTGVYYYRKVVPQALRPVLKKVEVRVSLRTKNVREAKIRYPAVAAEVQRWLGDHSPPCSAPAWNAAPVMRSSALQVPDAMAPALPLMQMFSDWAEERKPPQRTLYGWRRTFQAFARSLPVDDARRIAKSDVVAWKAGLLASGKSAKTVSNHLAIIRVPFGWAVRNGRIAANPVSGVSITARRSLTDRRLPYGDAEAKRILEAARREKGARRWVPWLLALTGARLEEVCQAWAKDVRREGGIWYLDINAEDAGKSLKNCGSVRKVPLHRALLAEGFLQYVSSIPATGLLFPDLTPDRFRKKGGNFTKWYGRWSRRLDIADRRLVAHSWRHRFKDQCRTAGIEKAIHDALTGHSAGDVSDGYGLGYPLTVLFAAISRLASPCEAEYGLRHGVTEQAIVDPPAAASVTGD